MSFLLFWNPSIRKVKELSPLCYPDESFHSTYGFGYDIVNDNYKVVAVFSYNVPDSSGDLVDKTEVKINILGTNVWKNLPDSPFNCMLSHEPGRFVSGNIIWLASNNFHHSPCFIVSLDLRKESYQKLLLPDCGELDVSILILSVLKDCLCMTYGHDVWIMKEYGNNESWTKLFTVPYMRYCRKSYHLSKTIYMFEDGRVLLEVESNRVESNRDSFRKLIVYDPRIGTFKFVKFQNKSFYNPIFSSVPEICIESLISTCF
jgi:F-box interacting protein